MRLIDADALMDRMYHEAFETDTDMQKWDSGCWIRYKMFENAIDEAPTIDAVSVVRCKECKSWKWIEWAKEYRCILRNTAFNARADDFCSYAVSMGLADG